MIPSRRGAVEHVAERPVISDTIAPAVAPALASVFISSPEVTAATGRPARCRESGSLPGALNIHIFSTAKPAARAGLRRPVDRCPVEILWTSRIRHGSVTFAAIAAQLFDLFCTARL